MSQPAAHRRVPRATYRLQLHAGFTFADAAAIAPYLAKLGISHVYASPVQAARRGSTHGYDVVDPARFNPELGGEEGFLALVQALKAHGLGLVVDIVPNHMGTGPDNPYWMSVLAHGRASPFAHYFDIDWERPGAEGRLLLPILGRPYGEALEAGEIVPGWDPAHGGVVARAAGGPVPLDPGSWGDVLDEAADRASPGAMPVLRSLAGAAAALGGTGEPGRAGEAEMLRRAVEEAAAADPAVAEALRDALQTLEGRPGEPETFDRWHDLLERQHWRLAFWRTAATDINYRRFFEVNDLAGVRVEDPEVFEATHALILDHVRAGHVRGLRVDHIDGLADPGGYLTRLREAVGPETWIVVEKILEPGEDLPDWPIDGTTGYEALNWIDGLFVDRTAQACFEGVFRAAAGTQESFAGALRAIRRETLDRGFAAEREALLAGLASLAGRDRRTRDLTAGRLRPALADILAEFPVYRTYRAPGHARAADREVVERACSDAMAHTGEPDTSPHVFIRDLLLRDNLDGMELAVVRRFEQLTGPLMAKSLEDTLFYRWVPLLALDEVGGDPPAFGLDPATFHERVAARAKTWPHSMVTTATHDTKRGEDTRARILALSRDSSGWQDAVRRFEEICRPLLAADAPDARDRLMLFQTILGAWPVSLLDGDEPRVLESFAARLREAMQKSVREAKRRTNWLRPDEVYENAMAALVERLLQPGSPFLAAFRPLARRLAVAGVDVALSRTVLKLTMPGVPDFYQGTEAWDFSLVDPDNRRPVDFSALAAMLADGRPLDALVGAWQDGAIKQRLTRVLLSLRRDLPDLFASGAYRPVAVTGPFSGGVVAFERRLGGERIVTAAGVRAGVVGAETDAGAAPWAETRASLPAGRWRDVLTGACIDVRAGGVDVAEIFATMPVAVLRKGV